MSNHRSHSSLFLKISILVIFYLSQVNGSTPTAGWDIFEKESVEGNSFSSTEGILSSLIANHVSAISGEFCDHSTDCVLAGPEPLILERSYSPHSSIGLFGVEPVSLNPDNTIVGRKYCSWQLNHVTTLQFQSDCTDHSRHYECSSFVPHASFSQMFHQSLIPDRDIKKGDFTLPLLHQKGITNCSSGAISGKTNPKNVNARFHDDFKKCSVSFGTGSVRDYDCYVLEVGRNTDIKSRRYRPSAEKKASGCHFIYENSHVYAYNPSLSTLYSWFYLYWKNKTDLHIDTSLQKSIVYRFKEYEVFITTPNDLTNRYYLSSVSRPDQPDESYEYVRNVDRDGWLLSRKNKPNNRFLEIDYYKIGDQPGIVFKNKITDALDPRNNRVKCLKAPVGTDKTPMTTHQFFYDLSYKSDNRKNKKKVTTYHGTTTVLDAYGRQTSYLYNEDHRLEKMVQYCNEQPYVKTEYLWKEVNQGVIKPLNTVIPFESPEQANLMGKLIKDSEGNILTGRFFFYDKKGNIKKEQFYGNLSGTSQAPIVLDKTQRPTKNNAEYYERSFSYSDDAFNLLLEEREPNGRTVRHTYVPNTDRVASKLILDHDRICAREFYEYDENNAIITFICDNGSSSNNNALNGVTERRITHYLPYTTAPIGMPKQTDEMVLDVATGKERLIKRTVQEYSPEGRVLKQDVYDAAGMYRYTLEWDYDAHGNLIKETNALGETITREYDDNDNLIEEHGPSSDYYTKHTYDFVNRRTATKKIYWDGTCHTTHFRYDLVGNRIAQIDRYGNETCFEYDDLNRLIKTTYPLVDGESGPFQPVTRKNYDCLGNVIEETDARGYVTKKTYNARGKVTSVLHPDGQLESFEYALDGSTLAKKTSSNGNKTYFTVDCFGRILSEKVYSKDDVLLSETTQTFDRLHKISSTDPTGLVTEFSYNEQGQLIKTSCLDKEEIYEYDALGRLAKKKEPFSNDQMKVSCFEYDLLDRVLEERIENEHGAILKAISYQYDVFGNRTHQIEQTQAGLSQTVVQYNADKKPICMIDPQGNETHIVYNTTFRNHLDQYVLQTISTDLVGRQTITLFDALERPVSIKREDAFGLLLTHQELTYDAGGNLIRTNNHVMANGQEIRCLETCFEYEAMGRLSCLTQAHGLPEQQITRTKYDSFGQKECVTKGDGMILTYGYDALGRMESYQSSDQSISFQYKYNERNQILEVKDLIQKTATLLEYDLRGRLIAETLSNGLKTSYDYDHLDRVIALTLPDASSVNYIYDAQHLKQVQRIKNRKVIYTHWYDDYDLTGLNLSAVAINQQECSYSHDLLKRPLAMESVSFKQNEIQYDSVGRLQEYQLYDSVGSVDCKFRYDENDHLISEEGIAKHHYACDSLHNRLRKDKNTYCSNGLHQLLSDGEADYTYDLRGNLILKEKDMVQTSYRYDANDQLIAINSEQEVRYQYDAFHRRVEKIEGGKTTRYLYVGQDEIGAVDEEGCIEELRILGQGHGAEIGASIALELKGKVYAPTHDLRGNIVSLADLAGHVVETYRYSAFGETIIYDEGGEEIATSRVGNPWRFSSKRYDEESGFVYFGRRYYDAGTGRWITADPAGLVDGLNLYAYLHHRPLHDFDLYGLQAEGGEGGEEPYYPLQNVERDRPFAEEDVEPNRVPDGYIEKEDWQNGKIFFTGTRNVGKNGIIFIHGIGNTLDTAYKTAQAISEMAGGHFVTFQCCNPEGSKDYFIDLVRSSGELFLYLKTERVRMCARQICASVDALSPGAMLVAILHSEGCIVGRNALRLLPKEYRERVIVYAFGPGAYIRDKYAHEVEHYKSKHDYIVPHLDIIGVFMCRHSTTVLEPHPEASRVDHSINGETYSQQIQIIMNIHFPNIHFPKDGDTP